MRDDNYRMALAMRLAEVHDQLELAELEAVAALCRWDEMGLPADMLNTLRQAARKVSSFRKLKTALEHESGGVE
jgi:hypothetical protein